MKNKFRKTIFPSIHISDAFIKYPDGSKSNTGNHYALKLQTYLRVKDKDGIYYLQYFYKEYGFNQESMTVELSRSKDECINIFLREVYNYIYLGIVNSNVKDINGKELFTKDEDQRSEEERLRSLMLT